jgi:hypothetical protein
MTAACTSLAGVLSRINEMSTNANGYGEPFVKRRGLFSMTAASYRECRLRKPEAP